MKTYFYGELVEGEELEKTAKLRQEECLPRLDQNFIFNSVQSGA